MASYSRLTAAPGTDIWRKPPTTDVFNAPTYAPPEARTTGPLAAFLSARVSFRLPATEQYDQAGLLLALRPPSPAAAGPPPKWLKTGVEFYNGAPRVGTVGCDAWADWSLAPVARGAGDEDGWVTVAVEKGRDGNGVGVWVHQVVRGAGGAEEKVPLREVCWVFAEATEGWSLAVSAYAARPATEASEGLVAEFDGIEVEWAE